MIPPNERFGPDPQGATPLEEEDYEQLIPKWVTNRFDLNAVEAASINAANDFYLRRRLSVEQIMDELFVRELHRAMFKDVWMWAGIYRLRQTAIGSPSYLIATEIKNLISDGRMWIDAAGSNKEVDLACTELHHRLVLIHPFKNGNGRFSRLYVDLILRSLKMPTFSWGERLNLNVEERRLKYLKALHLADAGDISPLAKFVRE
jgi:Fic-DOC domain mobile mystery protein B